ncbi:hypothetical protein BJF82_15005 [Kytococcus sp. CUA-901]|nr:hypothetical protein BJF82_15005 [Kytococcus sp. CUA-901]
MLQIIATATIAAVVGIGGLGRYLIDGQASRQYEVMAGGGDRGRVLASLVDLAMAGIQRFVVSPGLVAAREH